MTDVEKYFKEWGSVCRIVASKGNRLIHNHNTLLQFAEEYNKKKEFETISELANIRDCVHDYSRGTIHDMLDELICELANE